MKKNLSFILLTAYFLSVIVAMKHYPALNTEIASRAGNLFVPVVFTFLISLYNVKQRIGFWFYALQIIVVIASIIGIISLFYLEEWAKYQHLMVDVLWTLGIITLIQFVYLRFYILRKK